MHVREPGIISFNESSFLLLGLIGEKNFKKIMRAVTGLQMTCKLVTSHSENLVLLVKDAGRGFFYPCVCIK